MTFVTSEGEILARVHVDRDVQRLIKGFSKLFPYACVCVMNTQRAGGKTDVEIWLVISFLPLIG